MFGTDVLNKKSMVGQVRERFRKGRSQEMETYLKSIHSEISTFCTLSASRPRKNQIFKNYSRITFVCDLVNLSKVLVWKDKLLIMILVYLFTCYLFYRSTWFRQSLEEYICILGVTQTDKCSPLASVETKMHFSHFHEFSSLFAKFRVNRPNIPIFSRKC